MERVAPIGAPIVVAVDQRLGTRVPVDLEGVRVRVRVRVGVSAEALVH